MRQIMIEKINGFCKKLQCLSGAELKVIAIISMLIDHANKALIYPYLTSSKGFLSTISNLFDIIGRIAFPLFCFMVVKGFFKTRSRKKYLLNLLIFGVISEVPFDMFTTASFFNTNWQNGEDIDRQNVSLKDVQDVVSIMTGVPVQRLAQAEGIRLKGMNLKLQEEVVAQDKAIDKMVKAIMRNRVGLKEPNHPIGVFMFIGPTGVGKTYLAKKLAEFMFGSSDALIRVDMSEYTESFNVSRLVGAPPGYVGYEEGGQLTERVRRRPYSIVLLDEIEKAHSNVFNLLLQVLDEGRLTDGNGRFVDFRNTVIIMTSNAGTRQLKDFGRGVGFNTAGNSSFMLNDQDKEHARSIVQKALSKQFSPEFLNRMDEIITFEQLDLEAIKKIIDIELRGLFKRMEALGYQVQITDEAKAFVAERGYDVQFGARPLKRAIQNYIEDGIAELIIDGELEANSTISISKEEGKSELTIQKI